MATEKQREYIAIFIEKRARDGSNTCKGIWDATPRNNEKYPNIGANYKRLILEDSLSGLTEKQADYIIKAFLGEERGYSVLKANKILISLNLCPTQPMT